MPDPIRMDNAFFYVDSIGLSLTDVMLHCKKRGFAVNLTQFMDDAFSAGWSVEKTTAVIQESVSELNNEHVLFYTEKMNA